jgi:hypothetical protein
VLLVVLVAIGFVPAIDLADAVARTSQRAAALAGLGVLAWLASFVYFHSVADCSGEGGECTPDLGWFLLLFSLAGWLVGVLAGAAFTGRSKRKRSLGPPPR